MAQAEDTQPYTGGGIVLSAAKEKTGTKHRAHAFAGGEGGIEMRVSIEEFMIRLRDTGAEVAELSPKEVREYKNKWFRTFVPWAKDSDRLRAVCLGIDDDRLTPGEHNEDVRRYGSRGFLWYAYRDEAITECTKGGHARIAFDKQAKEDMVLVNNFARENTALLIKNAPGIKAGEIEELEDVTVTSTDFSWTYSKTHEGGWFGPYFYKR
ncbi:MAG: DUF4275 family protein [Methanomassiliicoccaceae archaeon]|nr:DUF4275 family protein [Methanomassiliicoccaceae archaeon]